MRAKQWMRIAAVASAIGLSGTAIGHGTDRTSSTSAATNDNAAAQMDSQPSSSGTSPPVLNGSTSSDTSAAATNGTTSATTSGMAAGTTQGSTMNSPRSDTFPGASGSAATSSGTDRLATTNSENFNQWMSDYAAQHNGQITRQQFLDEMGNRWDVVDTQRQGYLTPGEVREIFIFQEAAPARTGSDAQAGYMGPANTRAQ